MDSLSSAGARKLLEALANENEFHFQLYANWQSALGNQHSARPLFDHVIADGEGYLTRKHDPAERAQAEFSLATAYEDLVEVASRRLGDIDPSPYRPRLAEARVKALQYYSDAINCDPKATTAEISWRNPGTCWPIFLPGAITILVPAATDFRPGLSGQLFSQSQFP